MLGLSLVAGLIAAAGVLLAVFSLRPAPTQGDLVVERIAAYQAATHNLLNMSEEEARLPFRERVLWPMLRRFGSVLARRSTDRARTDIQRKLNLAGRPFGLSAGEFLAVRYVLAGSAAAGLGLFGLLIGPSFLLFGIVVGALIGFIIPRYLLASRVTRARREIRLSLPDAMDLMSVCVEAGLTFEGAMGKVAERYDNRLGGEFAQVLREIRLGRSRRDAMAELGERSGVDEVHSFAQAVIQSDALGTGIARILRIQSDELRRRRRQRAQEQGAKAGLKMLFPMVVFIFPSLWIVLLGPAGLLLLKEFSGGIG